MVDYSKIELEGSGMLDRRAFFGFAAINVGHFFAFILFIAVFAIRMLRTFSFPRSYMISRFCVAG